MGMIGRLLEFVRTTRKGAQASTSKIDPGGGFLLTCEHFSAPGDDGQPLPGDYVVTVAVPRRGGSVAVGYLDPVNAGQAGPGERRQYARDSGGAVVVSLWLKSNGSAILSNSDGSVELQAGGDVVINGVTIDAAGNITSPGVIEGDTVRTAAGIDLDNHGHPINSGSSAPGPTEASVALP